MARKHPHVAQQTDDNLLESSLKQAEVNKLPIEEMPLETLRDYRLYNEEARKLNKKLRICRYPIKQAPVELHPKVRIRFSSTNGCMNPVAVMLSNHLIHFDEMLTPGKEYDLPECIVHYLSEKGLPIWDWVTLRDGSRETQIVNKQPRFSLTNVYRGD